MQLKLGTQCGQDIKPRILTSAELFMIGSDPDWDLKHQLRTTEDNKEETGAGVYILSKNFLIAPKEQEVRGENFYNCPQFACCTQWNIFGHFMPFVGSI